MTQHSGTPEYAPDQLMRFHGVKLHHDADRLAKIIVRNDVDYLLDAVNQVLYGTEFDEDGEMTAMSRDPVHYQEAETQLQQCRERTGRRLTSPLDREIRQLLEDCITSCQAIGVIIDDHPDLAEPDPPQEEEQGETG